MAIRTIGSLWRKKEKDADKKHVLSGNLEMDGREGKKIKIFIYPNEKKIDTGPDYRICVITVDDSSPPKKSSLPEL